MKVEVFEQKCKTINIDDGHYQIDPHRMIRVIGSTTIFLYTCHNPHANIYPQIKGVDTRRFFREMDASKFQDLQKIDKEVFDSAMAQSTYNLIDA